MPIHKHVLIVVGILLFTLVVFFSWKAFAPTVNVIFPAGGESLVAGETYMLTWNGGADPLHIFLIDSSLQEQGDSVAIADRIYGVDNDHIYSYRIPASLPEGTYEFQIGNAVSKSFSIVQPFGYRCGDGTEFTLAPTLRKDELFLTPTTSVERFLKTTLYKKGSLYENGTIHLYPSGNHILFSTRSTTTECRAMDRDIFDLHN